MSTFHLTPDVTAKIARWFASDHTGVSSETIASIALGMTEPERHGWDMPYDSGDFGRCYRLIKAVPELRAVLPRVAELCPQWKPLVEIWDELVALYEADEAEEPVYEKEPPKGRGRFRRTIMVNKRSCNDRIRGLRDACMLAGGWTKTRSGWKKEGGL